MPVYTQKKIRREAKKLPRNYGNRGPRIEKDSANAAVRKQKGLLMEKREVAVSSRSKGRRHACECGRENIAGLSTEPRGRWGRANSAHGNPLFQ